MYYEQLFTSICFSWYNASDNQFDNHKTFEKLRSLTQTTLSPRILRVVGARKTVGGCTISAPSPIRMRHLDVIYLNANIYTAMDSILFVARSKQLLGTPSTRLPLTT